MKHYISILAFLLCFFKGESQSLLNKDSLLQEMCKSVQETSTMSDSDRITTVFIKHLKPYFNEMPKDSIMAIINFYYIRLQHECPKFHMLTEKFRDTSKSDWEHINFEPESRVNALEFANFFSEKKLRYLEANGDTVRLKISDSTWEDHFADGTYSKLSLKKQLPSEFVITFIESNNHIRKNFSKVGDKYRYKLIQKTDSYYLIFAEAVGNPQKLQFKMYY